MSLPLNSLCLPHLTMPPDKLPTVSPPETHQEGATEAPVIQFSVSAVTRNATADNEGKQTGSSLRQWKTHQ
jgi:hypothetical protein